jgi:hypothetical protein
LLQDPLTQGTVSITDETIVKHLIGIGARQKRSVTPNILKARNEGLLIRRAHGSQRGKMRAVMITI